MNRKMIFILNIVCSVLVAIYTGCKNTSAKDKLVNYVTKEVHGLSSKLKADSNEVLCQFIPEKKEDGTASSVIYRFMVSVYSQPEKSTDSVMYYFNYHAADYFRLINGKDTILPVLSERMANGRRDIHQFTVVFDTDRIKETTDSLSVLFTGNKLFADSLVFRYALNDIQKASKSLFGYE